MLTEFSDADVNAQAVAIQLDGTILIAGSGVTSTTTTDFWLSRYRTNGTLDNSFGTAGRVTTDFSGQADMAFGLAIQSDGKIVAAGAADIGDARPTDFALARYEGPTSQDLVSGLSDQVQTLVDSGALNQGQGNSLAVKLTNVLNSLSQGKTKTACNQLEAFINEVNAQVSTYACTRTSPTERGDGGPTDAWLLEKQAAAATRRDCASPARGSATRGSFFPKSFSFL